MKPKPSIIIDGIDIICPLTLQGKSGPWRIEVETIRRGEPVTLVNMRNAIYSGLKPQKIRVKDWDFRIHKLLNGGLVTSDCPNEIYTQAKDFNKVEGRVLVGGLGIGMASTYIANNPAVSHVLTVEINQKLISFIKPQLPKTSAEHEVIKYDLFKFIPWAAKRGLMFDSAYFDIWSPTGERAWMDYIVPLRRLMAKHYPEAPVYNWLESDMLGQLRVSLNMAAFGRAFDSPMNLEKMGVAPSAKNLWIRAFKPFDVFKRVLGDETDEKKVQGLIMLYLERVGTPVWEAAFGKLWDHWKKPTEKETEKILHG